MYYLLHRKIQRQKNGFVSNRDIFRTQGMRTKGYKRTTVCKGETERFLINLKVINKETTDI